MKVKVEKTFLDKEDMKTKYKKGTILEVNDEARAKDLVSRRLCKEYKGNEKPSVTLGEKPKEEKGAES